MQSTWQKFVRWLGETPETVDTTLNGLLNQVLHLSQGLLTEAEAGIISHGPFRADRISPHLEGRREFDLKGFWLGCCLEYALFRL
jgi:hypothetical protein